MSFEHRYHNKAHLPHRVENKLEEVKRGGKSFCFFFLGVPRKVSIRDRGCVTKVPYAGHLLELTQFIYVYMHTLHIHIYFCTYHTHIHNKREIEKKVALCVSTPHTPATSA